MSIQPDAVKPEPKTLDDCAWACGIELGVVVGNVTTPDNEEASGIIRAALDEAYDCAALEAALHAREAKPDA